MDGVAEGAQRRAVHLEAVVELVQGADDLEASRFVHPSDALLVLPLQELKCGYVGPEQSLVRDSKYEKVQQGRKVLKVGSIELAQQRFFLMAGNQRPTGLLLLLNLLFQLVFLIHELLEVVLFLCVLVHRLFHASEGFEVFIAAATEECHVRDWDVQEPYQNVESFFLNSKFGVNPH